MLLFRHSIISLLLATDFGLFSVGLCLGVLTIYMGLKTDGISQLGTERERVMIISTHPPMGKRCEWACKRVIICRMHHTHHQSKKTTVPKRDMHIQNEQAKTKNLILW